MLTDLGFATALAVTTSILLEQTGRRFIVAMAYTILHFGVIASDVETDSPSWPTDASQACCLESAFIKEYLGILYIVGCAKRLSLVNDPLPIFRACPVRCTSEQGRYLTFALPATRRFLHICPCVLSLSPIHRSA